MELEERSALVFGAGSIGPGWGNGKACAVAYARAGARVAVVDLDLDRADETAELIGQEEGEVIALSADVARAADVEAAVRQAQQHFGAIDALHNNVGNHRPGDPVSMSEADWDLSMDCNLKSVFLACKYALPVMLRQGCGAIINISSIPGGRHAPNAR